MFSFDGLSANLRHLVHGAKHYAQKGVYPPIRRNNSSKVSRFLDWARPSTVGKWTRLTVRERGGQLASHNKRSAVTHGSSLVAGKVVAATGLTVVSGGGFLAALGAAGAVFLVVKALKKAYGKYKRNQAKSTVAAADSPTELVRGLIGILSYGDIQNLARRSEKAVDHEKKFRTEQTASRNGFPTCVEAIRLAWRYERWYKRVEESIAQGTDYDNLCRVNSGIQEICADAAPQMADAGLVIMEYCCKKYDPTLGYTSFAKMTGGELKNEGIFFWPTWFEAASASVPLKSLWEAEISKLLTEARSKSGINVKQLEIYAGIVEAELATGRSIATSTGKQSMSKLSQSVLKASLSKLMSGAFRHSLTQVSHLSAGAIASVTVGTGMSAGISGLISIGAEIWNDRENMKILGSESGGRELSLEKRIFMLKHILEHGRLNRMGKGLQRLANELEKMNQLLVGIRAMDTTSKDSKVAREVKELAVTVYRAHKYLLEVLTLGVWVSRLVAEVGGMLIEMIDGDQGLKHSEVLLQRHLKDLELRGHSGCRGTCYGSENWSPLNGTDAVHAGPPAEIEMTNFGRAA